MAGVDGVYLGIPGTRSIDSRCITSGVYGTVIRASMSQETEKVRVLVILNNIYLPTYALTMLCIMYCPVRQERWLTLVGKPSINSPSIQIWMMDLENLEGFNPSCETQLMRHRLTESSGSLGSIHY